MLTIITVLGTSTTQRIDPFVFRDSKLASKFCRCDNASGSKINVVEGVHEQRIWRFASAPHSREDEITHYIHGWQIILFLFVGMPMASAVSAGLP